MNVTIESFFCPYCDEVTEAYFRLVNTILLPMAKTACGKVSNA